MPLAGSASGGSGGHGFSWTPAALLDLPASPSPLASPGQATCFDLTVTDGAGRSAGDSALVRVVGALTASVGPDLRLCTGGGSLAVTPSVAGGVAPLDFAWTASPPCAGCIGSPSAPATTLGPPVDTVFTLTVTDANGTTTQDSLTVQVQAALAVDAGPDRGIQRGEVTQLGTAGQPGLAYFWSCNATSCGIAGPSDPDPYAAPMHSTAYSVTVTDGATCTGTDTVLVTLDTRILATVPLEGCTPWPRDALSWVIFDGDIDPASLAGNVFLREPADGSSLAITTTYDAATRTLTVDPVGNGWSFTTGAGTDGTAPAVTSSAPVDGQVNVDLVAPMTVTWSEPIDPATLGGIRLLDMATGYPLAGEVVYDEAARRITLKPRAFLESLGSYRLDVTGVRDQAGNLAAPFSAAFATIRAAGHAGAPVLPRLHHAAPVEGAAEAARELGALQRARGEEERAAAPDARPRPSSPAGAARQGLGPGSRHSR